MESQRDYYLRMNGNRQKDATNLLKTGEDAEKNLKKIWLNF